MSTATASTTFVVSNVPEATKPLKEVASHRALTEFLGGPVEACSRYHGKLVAEIHAHPLIGALHEAFRSHRPIVLSPDIIWLTLCQGFAHHVNANAEALRSRLVNHSGKLKLTVRRDEFRKGFPGNDWPGVFAEFSAGIRAHVGDAQQLIVADFSTTGPVERAASEIVLLDTMQKFFDFELVTLCGIPFITLEGTPEDWQKLARRVREFGAFDLGWWVEPLEPLLQEFVSAAEGKVNRRFWESIYKWGGPEGSGSKYVSGWILNFFPYLRDPRTSYLQLLGKAVPALQRNPWLSLPITSEGPGRDDFPRLSAKAPFVWVYFRTEIKMEFVGGLMGVAQDATTLSLRPEIGWAVQAV